MLQFMYNLLPLSGLICCAKALQPAGFAHRFFENLEEAAKYLVTMDQKGHTMFLAQGGFSTLAGANAEYNSNLSHKLTKEQRKAQRREERTGNNVVAMRNFFLDIDCGDGKPYATQLDGQLALEDFCDAVGLPDPTIVNSGNGLYAHWFMTEDITVNVWRACAQALKQLCIEYKFEADPMRTADAASVLRPIGVHNRKNGLIKPVELLSELTEPIPFDLFHKLIISAAKHQHLTLKQFDAPKNVALNSEFMLQETPTSYAAAVAEKCAQLREVRDKRGDVAEPLWYHMIGLVKHSIEGIPLIHQWSEGHPDYTFQATEDKIEQWQCPPSTCAGFASVNPNGCTGCKFKNKITTPLQLGTPDPVEYNPMQLPEPPRGFIRTEKGIYYKPAEDIPAIQVYPNELFPVAVSYDCTQRCEVASFRHFMPHEGWKDFTIRSSIVHDPKACLVELHNQHVQVIGTAEKKALVMYVEGFIDKLKRDGKMKHLVSQMGWHEDNGEPQFALGPYIINKEGSHYAGFAHTSPEIVQYMTPKGEVSTWTEATKILGEPGMEPLAFALLCGAFAAPLLKFCGLSGALISLVGPSGAGKSLIGYWALSAYGDPDKLALFRNDTVNMLVSRLGFYGNLPLFLDEVTNIEGLDLSELVYRITQGRDKGRLGKDARERSSINSWQTLAISSSNASLIDKLGCAKSDASAEINRVFEYKVSQHPLIDQETGASLHHMIRDNYGGVGAEYIDYLVAHYPEHQEKLRKLTAVVNTNTHARSEERFWSAIITTAMYGGLIARSLGLVKFPIMPVIAWAEKEVIAMRSTKDEYHNDSVSVLGQFLDRHYANALIVTNSSTRLYSTAKDPRGSIEYTVYADKQLLYISRDVLRRDLAKNYASYNELKSDMAKSGALISHDRMKNLAAGTAFCGVQQKCWEIDLSHAYLLPATKTLVERYHAQQKLETTRVNNFAQLMNEGE